MKNNNNIFILFLDIFFVLFLCSALLVFTMILSRDGQMQAAGVYVIDPAVLATIIISILAYLYLMTKTSIRELSSILSARIVVQSSERSAEGNGTQK